MNHTFSSLLHSSQTLRSLEVMHARLLIDGSLTSSDLLLNKIIRVYSRFGATDIARKMFDEITHPNPYIWTSMIHGYVENNEYEEALDLLRHMRIESIQPLCFTVSSVLKALARQTRLKDGETIYGLALKFGLNFDLTVRNAIIDLFMRCGEVDLGRRIFDEMDEKDIVSWNSLISGYGNNGRVDVAHELFNKMPDRNVISWTSIICGYTKVRNMSKARFLFDEMPVKDLAVWKVMISGYMEIGDIGAAIDLFEAMPFCDVGTWNTMISGLCKSGELETAKEYFDSMPSKNVASWAMMLDGYVKSGNLNDARILFDNMPEKNLVSWSTMIGGYAKNGQPHAALELFDCFKEQGLKPDETFILTIIQACSQLGVVEAAESLICDHTESSLLANVHIVTSLIDMYAKCGRIGQALKVFEITCQKDLLCYSTMICAFANHGLAQDAISLLDDMRRANIKPDGVTFLGVLGACNHGGFVYEGRRYFRLMTEEFGIQANERHYACMVDLLGRSGCLEEALNLIRCMPMEPTSVVWGALLAACSMRCDVELAEVAAAELFKIEPENSGNYILLSNIYAAAGQWHDVAKTRAVIKEYGVRKNRGSSWIELESTVHEFVMADISHIDSDRIYFILNFLMEEMKLSEHLIGYEQIKYLECLGPS